MNQSFLFENNYYNYGILICTGIFLGSCYYFWIRTNTTAIPPQNNPNPNTPNMEAFTNEEIEAIINENATTVANNDNIDFITDSDSESDFYYDNEIDSDTQSLLDTSDLLNEQEIFFLNVDFNVCPIEELKFFEFKSFFAREIVEHSISDAEIMEFISWYSEAELCTNWINDQFLSIISIL